MHDDVEGEANQHQHDGAQECRDETSNMKSGNEGAGQQQDEGIDDQQEKPKGQNTQWEGQELQQKSESRIQKSDDQGCDQGTAEPGKLKAWHDVGANEQRDGAEQPDKQQVKHSESRLAEVPWMRHIFCAGKICDWQVRSREAGGRPSLLRVADIIRSNKKATR